MKKEVKLIFDEHNDKRYIKVGKDFYVFKKISDRNKTPMEITFAKIDKKEYSKRISVLSKQLVKHVKAEQIIEQALNCLPTDELLAVEKAINNPKKKARVRQESGCVDLNIGGVKIGLRQGGML